MNASFIHYVEGGRICSINLNYTVITNETNIEDRCTNYGGRSTYEFTTITSNPFKGFIFLTIENVFDPSLDKWAYLHTNRVLSSRTSRGIGSASGMIFLTIKKSNHHHH